MPNQIVQNQNQAVVGGAAPQPGANINVVSAGFPAFTQKAPLMLTKFQFRKLFTTAERMRIDNIQYSSSTPAQVKAAINTMQIDLSVSGEVDLNLKDTYDGVRFLATVGLITVPRAIRILQNLQPL